MRQLLCPFFPFKMSDKIFLSILTSPVFVFLILLFIYANNQVGKIHGGENVRPAHGAIGCKRLPTTPGKLGIVGGIPVEHDVEFPFQLTLYYQQRFLCGASIIDDRIGITAAHCVVNSLENPGDFHVVAGSRNLVHADDLGARSGAGVQIRRLTRIIVHPEYNNVSLIRNDIALFYVDEKFSFDKWVNKIRLPKPPGVSSVDSSNTDVEAPQNLTGVCVTATGWGFTSVVLPILPNILQQVELPVVDCHRYFSREWIQDDSNICAGLPPMTSGTCKGDSGGPLFINFEASSPLLVGLTSWSFLCSGLYSQLDVTDTPAVFTNVRYFTTWIHDTMSQLTLESEPGDQSTYTSAENGWSWD